MVAINDRRAWYGERHCLQDRVWNYGTLGERNRQMESHSRSGYTEATIPRLQAYGLIVVEEECRGISSSFYSRACAPGLSFEASLGSVVNFEYNKVTVPETVLGHS